jgi:hypothetical protein
MARPSFFQSSMPSKPDDRATTLKKIDEIEAQMSMQWWKTKHGGKPVAAASAPNRRRRPPVGLPGGLAGIRPRRRRQFRFFTFQIQRRRRGRRR